MSWSDIERDSLTLYEESEGLTSLHIETGPVFDPRDGLLARIPVIDPVILLGAEVVVLRPHDRSAAQAFGVDGDVAHRVRDLLRRRRSLHFLEDGFQHHAGNPAFR